MSSLPPITRQIIEEYSAHVPTQAKFLAQMSANSAFITASVHHYISPFDSSSAERPNIFKYSGGSDECFDADVVRLVAQILNDRSDIGHQHVLGWEVILAQLQQCLVTLSGTYFTSVSISSAAQSSSQLCRYLNSCNKPASLSHWSQGLASLVCVSHRGKLVTIHPAIIFQPRTLILHLKRIAQYHHHPQPSKDQPSRNLCSITRRCCSNAAAVDVR